MLHSFRRTNAPLILNLSSWTLECHISLTNVHQGHFSYDLEFTNSHWGVPSRRQLKFSRTLEIYTSPPFRPSRPSLRYRKLVGKTISWVKPCTSVTGTGVGEETIRINWQPGNENDLEPSTAPAGKLETTQPSRPSLCKWLSDSAYQPKNFKHLRE